MKVEVIHFGVPVALQLVIFTAHPHTLPPSFQLGTSLFLNLSRPLCFPKEMNGIQKRGSRKKKDTTAKEKFVLFIFIVRRIRPYGGLL